MKSPAKTCGGIFFLIAALLAGALFPAEVRAVVPPDGGEVESGEAAREAFIKGIEAHRSGDYARAQELLAASRGALPVSIDYALFYEAQSHIELGDTEKGLGVLDQLVREYYSSPLARRARRLIVEQALEAGRPGALDLLKGYVSRYPSDAAMRYRLALLLLEDSPERAGELFREIHINAEHPFDLTAAENMDTSALSLDQRIERAENLRSQVRYAEAESELRELLESAPSGRRDEVLDALAEVLFLRRDYTESARLSVEVGNTYRAARASLRAGRHASFEALLRKLIESGDERAGGLLLSKALGHWRAGRSQQALEMLSEISDRYESQQEDALWTSGWIYYLGESYGRAAAIFEKLEELYGDEKYGYWRARALEQNGESAAELYGDLRKGKGYYAVLSRLRQGQQAAHLVSGSTVSFTSVAGRPIAVSAEEGEGEDERTDWQRPVFERIDLLIEADLVGEAAAELERLSGSLRYYDEIEFAARKLAELRRYDRAIGLAWLLPEKRRPEEIMYPLAFWPEVKSVAEKNGMDPLLLLSVMREESRFDPDVTSRAGAIGLMQLMPSTARRIARRLDLELKGNRDLEDVETNLSLGAHYLSLLIEEFGTLPPALASYNAGEGRVRKWLKQRDYRAYDEFVEDIPFNETRAYVKRILTTYYIYRSRR